MEGNLKSASLYIAQPKGKPSVAVWLLTPLVDRRGRVPSYFIPATNIGHQLTLADVADTQSYNQQWQRIADAFRPHPSTTRGTCPSSWSEAGCDYVDYIHGPGNTIFLNKSCFKGAYPTCPDPGH